MHHRRLILVDDLPNLSYSPTQNVFHEALMRFVETKSAIGTPLVIIVSDEGRRGAETLNTGYSKSNANAKMDIRTVLPKSLLNSKYATEIRSDPQGFFFH
jgi:hypothetical protein